MTENNEIKVDLYLNAKGVPCPIPSMRVRLQMAKLPPGAILKVDSEAPHSKNSIPRYCRNFGHEILLSKEEDGVLTFIIKKRGDKEE
jgi:tRNA 2-thiouridine synthesizing protein A